MIHRSFLGFATGFLASGLFLTENIVPTSQTITIFIILVFAVVASIIED